MRTYEVLALVSAALHLVDVVHCLATFQLHQLLGLSLGLCVPLISSHSSISKKKKPGG